MRQHFPRITMGLGLLLALVLYRFSPGHADAGAELPLLTALFISEFGFLITAASSVYCALEIRRRGAGRALLSQLLGNLVLVVLFVYFGLQAWERVSFG